MTNNGGKNGDKQWWAKYYTENDDKQWWAKYYTENYDKQ